MNFFKRSGMASTGLWARATTSRFTILYVAFIVIYSVVQIGLRAQVFVTDSHAYDSVDTWLVSGRASSGRLPLLTSDSSIKLCTGLPSEDNGSCSTVWDSNSGETHIIVREEPSVLSDRECLEALNYPLFVLRTDLREDAVSLALQVFSLGLGILAITQKHVSHFATGIVLQIVSLIWASVRVRDTGISASDFDRAISNGACGGQLLGNFWSQRWGFDIAILAVDVLGFLLSIIFNWKAAESLGLTKVKSSKLSSCTNAVYKVMVSALVFLELSMFVSVAAGIVWIDQAFYLNLGMGTKALYVLAEVLMIPVLLLGWVALHREMWKSILAFLACSFIYLAGWGLSFALKPFQWSIESWRLFGFLSISAMILAFLTFICSLISACYFGKGMLQLSKGDDTQASIGSSYSRNTSASSLERGDWTVKELKVDTFDDKTYYGQTHSRGGSDMSTTLPTLAYAPRIPKAKAAAIARGLTVSPPPLH